MAWYDIFSNFYDASLEKLYAQQRLEAAEALRLTPTSRVLDLPCGTGQSFDAVAACLGPEGAILGVDASTGMLSRAGERVSRNGLGCVHLLNRRALELTSADVEAALGAGVSCDRALVFLGLTAFDEWQACFEHLYDLLQPGGRFVIVDCHAESPGLQGHMVQWMAQADLKRVVWQPLEQRSEGFSLRRYRASWQHGGDMIIAAGDKPA